jgi:cystathionine gamma-synthase
MASQAPKGPVEGTGIHEPGLAGQHLQTIAVTAGRPPRDVDAPFNQPVVFASTYLGTHEPGPSTAGYGRDGNPTWWALEEALGKLEGGPALTFASGMAAAHAIVELLPPGATIVLPVNCYLGSRR